ncbi:Protein ENDOSPERM DEFECTIVE 1 [Dichanthelium oligosanthes]|uniref:Protein ENDOSPERM DEFECTIVE 1 n=1 Tax=Dichanthelium oligosanthes TaxID=888268 RepID=A0A1E5W0H1_9POAL|nr:Protein ENDOSPERM DEFECTIVE 1 [Dichanthelium oligosanthes]
MAAASVSTAPPLGQMPTPASTPGQPLPPDPLPSAARPRPRCRVREVSSRYLSAPLPAQAPPRLSTSSPHSASVPPSTLAQHHHRSTPATAPAPFVFGLANENRPPPTPGSRKRGAAPDLFDAMHRLRPGPSLNPPAPLPASVSRATATPSPRRILRPSKASANVATSALQDRRGCARPLTPARTSFSFRRASSGTPLAPAAGMVFGTPSSCPRRAPCSEVRSPLQMTEGSRRKQNPFYFRALDSALSDCQPTLPQALVKPPQPPARKVVVVKKGAVVGGNKDTGKQEDVHQLRILDNSYVQYRFLNARAEAVAMAKNVTTEKSLYGLSERIAGLQKSVAEKKAELDCLKRVERVHSVLGAQVPFLENWSELEAEHSSCLGRGTAALRDASSRIPTIGNIRTNIGGVNEALQSAMKFLEELSPSVEKMSGKVQEVEDVAFNLAEVMGSEQTLLEECADLLHQAHNMQVMEDGLRTQLLHLKNQAKNKT